VATVAVRVELPGPGAALRAAVAALFRAADLAFHDTPSGALVVLLRTDDNSRTVADVVNTVRGATVAGQPLEGRSVVAISPRDTAEPGSDFRVVHPYGWRGALFG
jgi:hypothetical protein